MAFAHDGIFISWHLLMMAFSNLYSSQNFFFPECLGRNDFWQTDFWQTDFWQTDFWQKDFWQNDFWQNDFWQNDLAK
jgi:hypothetical protein